MKLKKVYTALLTLRHAIAGQLSRALRRAL